MPNAEESRDNVKFELRSRLKGGGGGSAYGDIVLFFVGVVLIPRDKKQANKFLGRWKEEGLRCEGT